MKTITLFLCVTILSMYGMRTYEHTVQVRNAPDTVYVRDSMFVHSSDTVYTALVKNDTLTWGMVQKAFEGAVKRNSHEACYNSDMSIKGVGNNLMYYFPCYVPATDK